MIARVFRVRVYPGVQAEFERKFYDVSLPVVKLQPGLISYAAGKPTKRSPEEYFLITTWENETALENFAGKDWHRPAVPAVMERFVAESWVHHYEVVEPRANA